MRPAHCSNQSRLPGTLRQPRVVHTSGWWDSSPAGGRKLPARCGAPSNGIRSHGDAWNGLGASLVERDAAAAIEAWRNAEKTVAARLRSAVQRRHADRRPSPREQKRFPYLRRFVAEAPRPQYQRDVARVEQRLKAIESRLEMTASPGRLACIDSVATDRRLQPYPGSRKIDQRRRPWIQLCCWSRSIRCGRTASAACGSSLGLTPTLDGLARKAFALPSRARTVR